MNKIILALALLVVVNAHFLQQEEEKMFLFTKFINQHNRQYETTQEFHDKFEIFKSNLEKVNNSESFSPFMDLTESEFKSRLNLDVASIAEQRSKMESYKLKKLYNEEDFPKNFDWRDHGAVSPVKNQGQCGSCWAFSTMANIEGQHYLKTGEMVTLSEQQLVDCDFNDSGCNGGWMDNAFQYLEEFGAVPDKKYKYTGKKGKCKSSKKEDDNVVVVSYKDIGQNEEEIKKVLYENGPLSIACNASPWQFYSGEIYRPSESECNSYGINHGITLVGYGEENGVKFWTIKNSWGEGWGEKGYIRIERGIGACGCNTAVSTAETK